MTVKGLTRERQKWERAPACAVNALGKVGTRWDRVGIGPRQFAGTRRALAILSTVSAVAIKSCQRHEQGSDESGNVGSGAIKLAELDPA